MTREAGRVKSLPPPSTVFSEKKKKEFVSRKKNDNNKSETWIIVPLNGKTDPTGVASCVLTESPCVYYGM